MRNSLSILALVTLFLTPSLCFANESMGTPAAKAEFEKGEAARAAGNFRAAAEAYRRAIEIDPDFAKAHENYIFVSQLAASNLTEKDVQAQSSDDSKTQEERERQAGVKAREKLQFEYEELTCQHPDRAIYQWALGSLNVESHPQAAERYIRNAMRIDPAFAPAFSMHLRAVFEKYNDQGLSVIAINIVAAQDDFVLSSLRGYTLDFTPAQDDKKVSRAYGVAGVPANYLIGADGRVWFHPTQPIFDLSGQRTLELQVESLLHLKNASPL